MLCTKARRLGSYKPYRFGSEALKREEIGSEKNDVIRRIVAGIAISLGSAVSED